MTAPFTTKASDIMDDKYDARSKAIAETINASTFSSNEQFVEKCRHLISSGLRSAVAEEREAWLPLYALAADYQIFHEGIMLAWEDKASPDAKATLERLRGDLFDACRHAREKTGLSAEDIASSIRSRGNSNE